MAAPSLEDVASVITKVAKKEGCSLPPQLAQRIAEKSKRNLRRAILLVESCKVAQYPFSAQQEVPDLDWELYLKETADQIVQEQSPRRVSEIRNRLYELISHCIPPEVIKRLRTLEFNIALQVIFVGLQRELAKNCDGELKTELCQMAAFYEHRLTKGNKAIYHLEAFVVKFMTAYAKFMESAYGDF